MRYNLSAITLPFTKPGLIGRRLFLILSSGTSWYLAGFMAANGVNFLFNIFLGRFLTFTDFGIFTVINAISYIGTIFLNAISATVNHRVSYLLGRGKKQEADLFFSATRINVFKASIVYVILWLLLLIPLSRFFSISSYLPILCLLPVLPCGFINSTNRGYLNGGLFLRTVGMLTFFEACIKFITAMIFVYIGLAAFAYVSFPISSILVVLVSILLTKNKVSSKPVAEKSHVYFPRKFFVASLAIGVSTTAFLAVDVLIVKHFMSSLLAGEYALLATMGKIIYFCGSLLTVLIISFVSREEGKGTTENSIFSRLFLSSLLLTAIPYIAIGWFGRWIAPLLFGEKTYVILPYLPVYALAIGIFTISMQIVSYYLAKKQYIFTFVTVACYLLMILGITLFHASIWNIVYIVFFVSLFELFLITLFHFLHIKKKRFL